MTNWRSLARLGAILAIVAPMVAACGFGFLGGGGTNATVKRGTFSSKEFGVSASPRVTTAAHPRKGGGRYLVGNPYTVRGRTYVPREQPNYVETGEASWYGSDFHGRMTANGEIFSANSITGAHPTLPIPSYVRVTNLTNGRSLLVRINDRGPYLQGRIIDVSERAASLLGFVNAGMANVKVEYVGKAPLEGDDTRMLLASLKAPNGMEQQGETRFADSGIKTTLFGAVASLFSYADGSPLDPVQENQAILSAHDAADAMATQNPELAQWAAAVDADARAVDITLGTFTDGGKAFDVELAFAALGAVDEIQTSLNGVPALALRLSHLKPGVAREDVQALARQLGLGDLIL